jgi:hypothetical protein
MKKEVIKKYVKDLDGLLKEVNEIGDYFLAWKGFPNHNMVIFLFGCLYKHLNFQGILIGHEEAGDLDALAFLDEEDVIIEFEAYSSNFKREGHDASKCNLIVCWEHDWKECPENIDVLELKHFWEMKP